MFKLTRIFSFHPTQIFLGKCPGPVRSSALTPQVPTGSQTALLSPPAMSGEDAKHSNPTQKGETASRGLATCGPIPGYSPRPPALPAAQPAARAPSATRRTQRDGRGHERESERAHPTRAAPGARNRCPPVTRASNAALCPAPSPHGPANTCSSSPGQSFPYRETPVVGKTLPERSCGWQTRDRKSVV